MLFLLVLPAGESAGEGLNIAITAPVDGATVSGTVTVRGTAACTSPGKSVVFVEIEIDSGGWSRARGTRQWYHTFDTSKLSDGWHVLRARCSDGDVFSSVAGIDFESRKAATSGDSLSIGICVVVLLASVLIGVAVVLYYMGRSGSRPPVQQQISSYGSAPPGLGYLPRLAYVPADPPDQLEQYRPEVIEGSPYYNPWTSDPGESQTTSEPERNLPPGQDTTANDDMPPNLESGSILPPLVVDEYGDEAASPVVEVIEGGDAAPQEVAEMDDLRSSEPAMPLPGDLPEPDPSMTGTDRQERVMRSLLVMPRGLPLPLLGIPMHELAGMILHAERKNTPGGSPLVRLKDRWYHADESDLRSFMVEYRQ